MGLQFEEHLRTQRQNQHHQRFPTGTLLYVQDYKDDIERRRHAAAVRIDVNAKGVEAGCVIEVDADASGDGADGVNGRLDVDVDAEDSLGSPVRNGHPAKAGKEDFEAFSSCHRFEDVHAQRQQQDKDVLSSSSPRNDYDDDDDDNLRRITAAERYGSG